MTASPKHMFSRRTPGDLSANALTAAVGAARAAGRRLLDLTASNPTKAGIEYPADLLAPLADSRGLVYSPEPLGLEEARRAVAADFARRGVTVPPERIVLTASTSEAYSLLFKVLCDPGDRVLVPRPSYPLFEHLTRLDAVAPVPYDLVYHGAWSIDIHGLERALQPGTRALLVVHPNNPTGSFISRSDGAALMALCAKRGIAIVADEVFADYELTPGATAGAAPFTVQADALTFSLGGLSKTVGLPQVKLGWIAVSGPDHQVSDALARLEFASDAYLSASTPAQLALPVLLERGAEVRRRIHERVVRNYGALCAATADGACQTLPAEGGWYAVVRVPSIEPEESLVLTLLREHDVLVHPGYFFDFPHEAYLIVSLLPPPEEFREAVARVVRYVDRLGARR